ncbi:MAG: zeta toxin family protein [Actinobacteria bacterium]|nr:zeta toxin family protein [Actinomycetota bacterium]
MGDPVLHLIVGANGAGKSTFFRFVVEPETALPFVNADEIAAANWPGDTQARSYDAARLAAEEHAAFIAERRSFAAETVFSHPSKIELVRDARSAGYVVVLHVVLVPEAVAVGRVAERVAHGLGHPVPEHKIRERFARLWDNVVAAVPLTNSAFVYDNSSVDTPYRIVATFRAGRLVGAAAWPRWAPDALRSLR